MQYKIHFYHRIINASIIAQWISCDSISIIAQWVSCDSISIIAQWMSCDIRGSVALERVCEHSMERERNDDIGGNHCVGHVHKRLGVQDQQEACQTISTGQTGR